MQTHLNVVVLITSDLAVSQHFYQHVLGLDVAEVNPGAIVFGQAGGAELVVMQNPHASSADRPGASVPEASVNAWFVVPDADAYHAQVREAGAQAITDPADGPFGRMFVVTSPDGHALTFHQH